MSNETGLDWLARNVHVWPEGKCEVLVCWPRNVGTLIWSFVLSDTGWITKDQWLARRAELQGKPSWSSLQKWANWIFQNGDGFWYATENKPSEPDYYFRSRKNTGGLNALISQGEVLGDWRDTLERRPERT